LIGSSEGFAEERRMKKYSWAYAFAMSALVIGLSMSAQAQTDPTVEAPTPADIVTLKDGSVIHGEVLEMADGILFLKNPSNPDNMIKLKWEDVTQLSVTHPIPFHLKEGTVLNGTATTGPDGKLNIQMEIYQPARSITGHICWKSHRRLFSNDRE
jgi:hypothetical protein